MFEEGNRYGTGTYMGSDGGSQSADGNFLCVILPQMFAVVNVFLQQLITQTGITQTERTGEIYTVSFFYLTDQEVTAVFGAAGFPEHNDLTV